MPSEYIEILNICLDDIIFKVLVLTFRTTTMICASGGSTRDRALGFDAHHRGPPTCRGLNANRILRDAPPPHEKRYGHTIVTYAQHLYVFGAATGQTLPHDLHCYVAPLALCQSLAALSSSICEIILIFEILADKTCIAI